MDFNYTKIKIGNWLYKNYFPLYKLAYFNFKKKNDFTEIQLIKQLVQPGNHILDIGANIGFYGNLLSKLVGENGKIYCFEPNKANYKRLFNNTSQLKNVVCFNMAISEKGEKLKLYTSKLLNVDHRSYPVENYDKVEEIEANSIDNLIDLKLIDKVDFIKIDIQGYEINAFKGMQILLENNPNIRIIAEYWPHGVKRAGSSSLALFDFFQNLGFDFQLISENKLSHLKREFIIENEDKPFEFSFNVLIAKKTSEN